MTRTYTCEECGEVFDVTAVETRWGTAAWIFANVAVVLLALVLDPNGFFK